MAERDLTARDAAAARTEAVPPAAVRLIYSAGVAMSCRVTPEILSGPWAPSRAHARRINRLCRSIASSSGSRAKFTAMRRASSLSAGRSRHRSDGCGRGF
jgi:hypothetical protein